MSMNGEIDGHKYGEDKGEDNDCEIGEEDVGVEEDSDFNEEDDNDDDDGDGEEEDEKDEYGEGYLL